MIDGCVGCLRFTTELVPVVREAEVLFIAVGTPPAEIGAADLANVADVAREIDRTLAVTERRRPLNMVNKSTMPVGAGDYVSMLIPRALAESDRLFPVDAGRRNVETSMALISIRVCETLCS